MEKLCPLCQKATRWQVIAQLKAEQQEHIRLKEQLMQTQDAIRALPIVANAKKDGEKYSDYPVFEAVCDYVFERNQETGQQLRETQRIIEMYDWVIRQMRVAYMELDRCGDDRYIFAQWEYYHHLEEQLSERLDLAKRCKIYIGNVRAGGVMSQEKG